MFVVFEIMTLEHVAGNSVYYDENTCVRQSTSYQVVLRFKV